MENDLRNIITSKILSNIQPRVKPIDYLMEALNISRESVYRRIRGDISFTLEEIAKLSVELEFSIDELIIKDMHSRVFFDLQITPEQDPVDMFETIFKEYLQNVFIDITFVKEIESIMVLNRIPPEFILFFNHLFKFYYYRWMHQNQESSLKYHFSDVNIPERLVALQQKAIECLKKVRSNTIIIDPNVFLNLIKEIQYYRKRRLINEDEFELLKNDLLSLVNMVESIAQTGLFNSESKYNIYLSSLSIESSSRHVKYDDQTKSIFFTNSIDPVAITNANLCTIHKKWLNSMRKYATLITQSNEILQVRYFNKQRSYIEDITDTTLIDSLI